jgi:hypothetical protein
LDRINLVRRHCVDPVPDNDCVDSREDDRCFKIASTIFPNVAHRALLTSFELVQEAKKGNLTKVAAVRFDGYGSAFSFEEKQMTEVTHSDSVSTASANATIFSGRLTLCTVRSSTKSFMPCKKRRNIDRAIMHHAQKSLMQMVDDDDEEHMSTGDRKKVSFQLVSPGGAEAVENEQDQSSNIFDLKDVAHLIQDLPDHRRVEILDSIRNMIVHIMAPVAPHTLEPDADLELPDQPVGRLAQPLKTICSRQSDRQAFG